MLYYNVESLTMITFILAPLLVLLIVRCFLAKKSKDLCKSHVVITGGSSGIGKAVATYACERGAHVTIIARNETRLEETKKYLTQALKTDDQILTSISADVSDKAKISSEFKKLEANVGPIDMLINCAGLAICGETENMTEDDVQTLFKTNYLGTLFPIQAVIPGMKARKQGCIVLTASQVALMGIYGYSVYSSCKFALRGLAESLRMELVPYNVSVTLALPPDTDTPGYETENKTKPKETKLISQTSGLVKPEEVGLKLLTDALEGKFFSYVGFDSAILTTLCVGMAPFDNFVQLILQSFVLGPLRLIGVFYLNSFENIVKNCHSKKTKAD